MVSIEEDVVVASKEEGDWYVSKTIGLAQGRREGLVESDLMDECVVVGVRRVADLWWGVG